MSVVNGKPMIRPIKPSTYTHSDNDRKMMAGLRPICDFMMVGMSTMSWMTWQMM